MHLKSLTLRGFKSFASSTTLHFEPGITCVVGPNGSGKSNVVDAIAWVMGEQGAKSLRGGKMEDVIFAGTSGRPPLGRAEVLLTIDNHDGVLPIDYAEVTISRTMFRNGGSEYAINGTPCRLLDVQELLSDSGIGREMHVIVGQGKLDEILSASPEDRRGFVEEAAGVLKHRKRKEKALRKLDAMQANLTRLQDLTTELRRQLKPLGKQAEVARRAAVIQADLRDSRLRLIADDLLNLRDAVQQEVADETALRERRGEVESELAGAQAREAVLDAEMAGEAPALARAQDTWFRLSSLRERVSSTAALASERVRLLAPEPEEERRGRDPEELDADAKAAREEEAALGRDVAAAREVLAGAVTARATAEGAHAAEEQRLTALQRAAADRREGLVRLTGQVHAATSRLEARAAELERLAAQAADARARADKANADFHALETQVAGLDEGEVGLDEEHEIASSELAAADGRVQALRMQEQEAERERHALTARVEALELGLARKDGGAAVLAAGDRLSGVLGTVAALLRVRPGYEAAVSAALGPLADAVAVGSVSQAVDALTLLKSDDAGRASLLVAGAAAPDRSSWPALPAGAVWAVDVVEAPDALRGSVGVALARVALVEDLATAGSLVRQHDVVAVTRAGDVVAAGVVHGGSASAPSLLEVQAAVDEARTKLDDATHRYERAKFELVGALEAVAAAQHRVDSALSRLHESDARMAAVAEQLGQLGSASRAASGEADRIAAGIASATAARDADQATLEELTARLEAAEATPDEGEPSHEERDRLAEAAVLARQGEVEARLAVRTGEERVRALAGRAEQLEHAANAERAARARSAERRASRARAVAVAAAVRAGAAATLVRIDISLAVAASERDAAEQARTVREGELLALRTRTRELQTELEALTSSVHRDEMARAEQRMRIEQLEARAMEEFGVDAETLETEYAPDVLVPPSMIAPGDEVDPEAPEPEAYPYVREEQEKRMRSAERSLNLLGKVNPLALEEFSALEERHRFLNEQLDDLKRSRAELLGIVTEVDARVQQVFAEAYADVEREFERIFARLFPGGEGRLFLTDPGDLLTTGIEVEARPPGKKVKRLSLLSGGERSLTAVAFLVALFKARPSPFYIMDEVEAALDDVNLQRLLGIMEELREDSQLLVITHQKRTMEIADALYGVSMRGDGVTTVIGQRMASHRSGDDDGSDPVDVSDSAVPA
ncbi:chromosome segregation protein SMC [Longivirga aurantiaca]|uniref:Chromosome partition protein Smc n=1 Tax=Longivirga aurantiaca TaxID=1837743 RepID=A0ABW1T0M1_9ACTN